MTDSQERAVPELLACPFCGSAAGISSDDGRYFVSCQDCFCCLGEAYDSYAMPAHIFYEREAAIAAWNTRSPPTGALDPVWRPIETAPKDGTVVDLWSCCRLTDCRWESSPYAGDISWGWTNQSLGRITSATHWMPLPAPPVIHASDCALHNAPALPVGQCDCGALASTSAPHITAPHEHGAGGEHTPLPWRFEGPDDFGDYNILHNEGRWAIGAVVSNLNPPEVVKANIDLIINSVNSLPAAEKALEEIAGDEPRPILNGTTADGLRNIARTALLAIRGSQTD